MEISITQRGIKVIKLNLSAKLVLIVTLFIPFFSGAKTMSRVATKKQRHIANDSSVVLIKIKVIHSDIVSEMTLTRGAKNTFATMKNNRGIDVTQKFSKSDFAYTQWQFDVATDLGHASCPKSYIEVNYFDATKKRIAGASVCYHGKTEQSKEWTEAVESLAKAIHFHP
jgi:hypothetical protein